MCPSYMATLDEEHSTRGRANALRAVLSGKVPRSEFTGRRMYEVLDLCLECKACKAECPANVDMAKIKYEFLAHYYRANGLPLRNRLFGRIHALARIGSALAPVSNWIARSAPHRWLLERVAGIDRRRPLPAFAAQSFDRWFGRRQPEGNGARGEVVLFHDTFNTYQTPSVAIAATRLLEALGYRVVLADRGCCGRPMISKGMLDEARTVAADNVARLARRRAPGPADRRARALVPPHAPGRVPGAGPHRGRAPRGAAEPPPRGVPPAGVGARRSSRSSPPHGRAGAAPRPLPPEGAGRDGPHGGRPEGGGLSGDRGGRRLLRDGGVVRLRGGALRPVGQDRRAAPRAGRARGGRRRRRLRAGHLVPPAGGAHDGARAEAPGGAPLGGPRRASVRWRRRRGGPA